MCTLWKQSPRCHLGDISGYRRAHRDLYRWSAIGRGAAGQPTARQAMRHLADACGWKRFEPLWDLVILS
jgi:hypothetical protein